MLWASAIFAIFILLPIEDTSEDIHTERFCAYGRVFVEFQKGGKVWGTVFLDDFGKPLSCDKNLEKFSNNRLIS